MINLVDNDSMANNTEAGGSSNFFSIGITVLKLLNGI